MKTLNEADLHAAYNGSYYTIEGAGGDITEWQQAYEKMMIDIGKPKEWYRTTGADINAVFDLQGKNAYPDDLTILMFPLDDLDIGILAVLKMSRGDRWFDDIIDNSREQENENE